MHDELSRHAGEMTTVRAVAAATALSVAAASFVLGVLLPIIKLNRFLIFSDEHSIATMLQALFSEGEWLLGLIILTFSILLPALKIALLSWLLVRGRRHEVPPNMARFVGALGKWSMLDVLIVALVIVAVKTSGVGSALSRPGLYFFCLSVLMTMIAAMMVRRPAA